MDIKVYFHWATAASSSFIIFRAGAEGGESGLLGKWSDSRQLLVSENLLPLRPPVTQVPADRDDCVGWLGWGGGKHFIFIRKRQTFVLFMITIEVSDRSTRTMFATPRFLDRSLLYLMDPHQEHTSDAKTTKGTF